MSTTKLTVSLLGAGLILGLAGCGEKDGDTGGNTAVEICDNNLDDDADGAADCLDADCAAEPACLEEETCDDGVDGPDADGLIDCDDPDCDGDDVCVFFEPAGFAITFYVGYNDGGMSGYSGVSQGQAFSYASPLAVVELFEEEYFEAYDDRYSCAWVADIVETDTNSFGLDIWGGWDYTLVGNAEYNTNLESNGTLCNDLDPESGWQETTPATVFEGLSGLGFGFGAISADLRSDIVAAVGQSTYDTDWAPSVFGGYTSLDGANATNYHYCFGSQTDSSMAIQYDDASAAISMEIGEEGLVPPEGVEDLGPYYSMSCQAAYILYTSNIGL
ncbi:MAG: hypothetical protein H6741_09535 [Alphaproteobacteria bacterium]|nr:hypothetical protein [Alphaproteobacteria bacterium]